MGPIVSLPWGFVLMTFIGVCIMALVGVVAWKCMYHEPDDYVDLEEQEFKFNQDV
ncbi:MAG: hypothetical protein LBD12_07590 [Clostridiales Family XIII bacterium]|jgi:hypothetical protein|nr:hypothetical protein [Clostridiales Family XIII bacterium]